MAQFFEYDGRNEGYHFDLLGSSMHVSKKRLHQPMANAFDYVWLLPSGQSLLQFASVASVPNQRLTLKLLKLIPPSSEEGQ